MNPSDALIPRKSWNPFTWVSSSDGQSAQELQAESDRLDARLAELNQASRSRYGDEWYAQAETNRLGGGVNVERELTAAGQEGLAEGYANVTGTIRAGINAPFRFLWDSVPGWVWLAALVAGFFYLGGANVIRRKLQ